ncbi:adenosylcobinamide amidohydrolase [Telmatospirillum sp.]|uniref:adenosylcobinamide amidohydrolase n=1 Tax=Telmatospirillum sp. TaxID=2079197 RepID=UPI00284B1165|nr:adenosylcobinamide amidohydrolase [Telmatospirillum sp.]MDR3435633.1 adenosylcobinamide amidohydrolase [Telmatospirillum sp.]
MSDRPTGNCQRAPLAPRLREPWLCLDLGADHQMLGWPVVGPSLGVVRHIAWLQVADSDLPAGADPAALFRTRAMADGIEADAGLMTAAAVRRFSHVSRQSPAGRIDTVATAGLSNGESVLPRPATANVRRPLPRMGTINLVATLPRALSIGAALEALSIAAEARTAAVMGLGLTAADGRPVTGTGTDCILIAAPSGEPVVEYCGLHTDIGRFLGETVYQAVQEASRAWMTSQSH